MIRLTRDRTAVPAGFCGNGRLTRERDLVARRLAGQSPRSQVWKTAKNQLKAEAGGKCAYCEGKAAHVAHGDVEHYRPKDVYWWLAYCYDNYVYSCQVCNQSYKGANFPFRGTSLVAPSPPPRAMSTQTAAFVGTLAPDPLDTAGGCPGACRSLR
jgi:5-methylcytosine-specific restriction endonuclease McrA